MRRLPWTKFQDFYLRLGFLKILVAVLSPQRRSDTNESIVRKLAFPLFDNVSKYPGLAGRVANKFPKTLYNPPDQLADPKKKNITVAEALIVDGDCKSYLSAVTGPTAYKILDWGRNVEFVGKGNQISERGLLLRVLLDQGAIDRFLGGDVDAWNPFVITPSERIFFLYHLAEIDGVTLQLTKDVGELKVGTIVESKAAASLTSKALIGVLSEAKNSVQARDILSFRTACELAVTIATEVGDAALAEQLIGRTRPRAPAPVRPSVRHQSTKEGKQPRRANKNADHQTIPRFEQLVDLGFLDKASESGENLDDAAARRKWRYRTTEASARWSRALLDPLNSPEPFLWHGFARACLSAKGVIPSKLRPDAVPVASYFDRAYALARRSVGYDPLDSIALIATILAINEDVCIEMADFHRLMLAIKQNGLFPDHIYFASGNDLDRMFVLLKPGFVDQIKNHPDIPSKNE